MNWYPPCGKNCPVPSDCGEIRRCKEDLNVKTKMTIFPMQCSCGHIFLEKYQYHKPLTDGRIGFCWCGFCRKKTFVTDSSRQSAIRGNGGDSGSDAKPPRNTFQRNRVNHE